MQNYRNAWREGDSTKVLSFLSDDFVLFRPGKEGVPIKGKDELKKFWFAKSDITYPIVEYKITNEEIVSSKDLAYYQGISNLTWYTLQNEVAEDTTLSVSEFLTILKKEDENWKIVKIMYNPKNEGYER